MTPSGVATIAASPRVVALTLALASAGRMGRGGVAASLPWWLGHASASTTPGFPRGGVTCSFPTPATMEVSPSSGGKPPSMLQQLERRAPRGCAPAGRVMTSKASSSSSIGSTQVGDLALAHSCNTSSVLQQRERRWCPSPASSVVDGFRRCPPQHPARPCPSSVDHRRVRAGRLAPFATVVAET